MSNELLTILIGLGGLIVAAGWRLLDLLLPKGRIFKWVDENTVEINPEEGDIEYGYIIDEPEDENEK